MKQTEDESKLGWHDAVLIIVIIAVLVVAFLFQVAHRSEALPRVVAGVLEPGVPGSRTASVTPYDTSH